METKDEDFFYDESVASMLSDFKNNLPDSDVSQFNKLETFEDKL